MPFTRDRFTWLAYLMLGYYAYLLACLGPLMPFLRAELRLDYAAGGLHFSAFALGMILAGLTGDRLARRWGRKPFFWGGAGGMAGAAMLLAASHRATWTVASAFLMGWLGSLLLVTLQAGLIDRHEGRRATALTEANVMASVFSTLAPLSIGGLQQGGIGWRGGLFLAAAFLGLLVVGFRRTALPPVRSSAERPGSVRLRLPAQFWAYWVVAVLSVSVEWCLIFWGADFLESVAGLERSAASTVMSVFFVAAIAGRLVGSRLTRTVPGHVLLLGALAISAVGFPFFWLGWGAALNVGGLFLAGLGVANLFPLTLATATSAATTHLDAASARISMGSGIAILLSPLVMGWIADRLTIQNAYGLVAVLILLAGVVTLGAQRLGASRAPSRL